MKILVAITHFYNPEGGGGYASLQPDPEPRIAALTESLRALFGLFGQQQSWFRYTDRLHELPANRSEAMELEVVICPPNGYHLLDEIPVPGEAYRHHETNAEHKYLGYECHQVLAGEAGNYDYYVYLEDDLVLHDPLHFDKLKWFSACAGDDCLLQPNRYELNFQQGVKRAYIDPEDETPRRLEAGYLHDERFAIKFLGRKFGFRRTNNPHAGCFFLNAAQVERWVAHESFGVHENIMYGPLESAASWSISRAFKVYKPGPRNANFLEIRHFGDAWSRKIYNTTFT
ncbi:MAG: calcium-binding protein [Verrucomicrobiales bacterium]